MKTLGNYMAEVVGTGMYVPVNTCTNGDLEKTLSYGWNYQTLKTLCNKTLYGYCGFKKVWQYKARWESSWDLG